MKDKQTRQENQDKIQISIPLNKQLLKYLIIIFALVFVFYIIVAMPQKLVSGFSFIIKVLSPFVIGFCLAYVVNLLLRPLERFWMWLWRNRKNQETVTKLKRPICLISSFLIVLGVIFAIVFMIIPAFKETIVSFAQKIPQYVKTIEGWYYGVAGILEDYNFTMPELSFDINKISDVAKNVISNYGENMIDKTVNVTTSIFSAVVDVFVGLVFSVYLLAQKEKLSRQTRKVINVVLKPKLADKLIGFTALTNKVFTKFVTGQLTEAVIIGVLCFFGMLIFGLPYAGIISVLVGFTALIPIFGAFIGTGMGAFLILLESPIKAVWFIVFIVVLQQLEGNLIYPRVVGKSVGLPGIWVLAAVTVGSGLFGFVGILFSVPVCSIMYVLFREFVNKKNKEYKVETTEENPEEMHNA